MFKIDCPAAELHEETPPKNQYRFTAIDIIKKQIKETTEPFLPGFIPKNESNKELLEKVEQYENAMAELFSKIKKQKNMYPYLERLAAIKPRVLWASLKPKSTHIYTLQSGVPLGHFIMIPPGHELLKTQKTMVSYKRSHQLIMFRPEKVSNTLAAALSISALVHILDTPDYSANDEKNLLSISNAYIAQGITIEALMENKNYRATINQILNQSNFSDLKEMIAKLTSAEGSPMLNQLNSVAFKGEPACHSFEAVSRTAIFIHNICFLWIERKTAENNILNHQLHLEAIKLLFPSQLDNQKQQR
jgi:hypothetical protein